MRNHRVRLTDLRPERQYEVTVEVGEQGRPACMIPSHLFSRLIHDWALSGQIAAVGSVAEFVGTARSAYRVSLGVDRGDDLLGWWRFSDAKDPGVDLSSRRRDAALKGDAMIAAGWFGRGVELDGKGAFVNMPGIADSRERHRHGRRLVSVQILCDGQSQQHGFVFGAIPACRQ